MMNKKKFKKRKTKLHVDGLLYGKSAINLKNLSKQSSAIYKSNKRKYRKKNLTFKWCQIS